MNVEWIKDETSNDIVEYCKKGSYILTVTYFPGNCAKYKVYDTDKKDTVAMDVIPENWQYDCVERAKYFALDYYNRLVG